jgi:hypothetical protein
MPEPVPVLQKQYEYIDGNPWMAGGALKKCGDLSSS